MDVVIVLTPLFLGGIAFVAWSVAVGRVRAERRRWRTIRQELDAASERILAP
jgi:hypothetical protein